VIDARERLERGAGLATGAAGVGREVHPAGVRVAPVVVFAAADHRPHVAGSRVDHGHRGVGVLPVGQDVAHGVLRGVLDRRVERGRDA
jgi:hypothetical protein